MATCLSWASSGNLPLRFAKPPVRWVWIGLRVCRPMSPAAAVTALPAGHCLNNLARTSRTKPCGTNSRLCHLLWSYKPFARASTQPCASVAGALFVVPKHDEGILPDVAPTGHTCFTACKITPQGPYLL